MAEVATIYLVRHAEAVGADHDDPDLSALGEDQARRLAERFRGVELAAILHSPRRRAARTASLIHELDDRAELCASDLLDDRTPVPFSGRTAGHTERLLEWLADVPERERDVDGVTIDAALRELTRYARVHGSIVAVTHNFVIGAMIQTVLQSPPPLWTRFHSDNAGVTRIDCSDPLVLRSFNT